MQNQTPTRQRLLLAGASLQLLALAGKKGTTALKEKGKEALEAANQSKMSKPVAV